MEAVKVTFNGHQIFLDISTEFEELDNLTKLNAIKDLIYELRIVYSEYHKEFKTKDKIERTNSLYNITKRAFERSMLAYKYRQQGMIFKDVCKELNVSANRAQQMVAKAERLLKRMERESK
jgi:hypothetical protein